ncbi:MAG: PorV/PorQ family protein [Elusimicrobia bacterium]|nr:PorV/PorQ family protein [Elusimicrobiota bacterium]
MRAVALFVFCHVLSALCSPAWAGFGNSKDVGTSGAQFLKVGAGGRPAGMGEAFSAVADDANAIYYNPAGLAFLERAEVTGMHNQFFQGLDYEFAAFALPLRDPAAAANSGGGAGRLGTLGVAIYNLSVDGLERRLTDTDAPAGSFEASDFAYAMSFARKLSERTSLGLTAKYVRQKLDSEKASAFAADLGALHHLQGLPLSLSLGVRHLGSQPKFKEESDPLPTVIFAGAGYRFRKNLIFAADLGLPRDNSLTYAVGGEYEQPVAERLSAALRAGYNSQNADPDGLTGLSVGAGITFYRARFDFAWVPFGDLGNTFRYALLIRF